MPQTKPSEESVRDSLKGFLRLRSEMIPILQYCPDCGTLCVHISTQTWLDGDEESWSIPLPFCLHCHPELAERIAFDA